MKKTLCILLFGSLIFGSCTKNTDKETDNIRFMFDPGDLRFISSSFNPDMQTMSALYGNSIAILLLSNPQHPQQHASLKLVTYKMQDDPNYFGSKVNGELILVETLKPGLDGVLEYHTEFGQIPTNQSKEQRISHILDNKPVTFPQ
ncbi:hypothetical protein [Sphingobacterium prati]|uniref:hypothetical protein n=1 Tax=Sphingobacterium prati TaxID=2737006 RepID=UPI0015580273|nr:hypothetical protein [Sphingobacterium prati]NPE46101.1 hypothetical protein [Sphingobacterium prati]